MNSKMAHAKESPYFSPLEKGQEASYVENSKEKRWDVLGAIACANGHNGEGAAAAGKELMWWEGPCCMHLIE